QRQRREGDPPGSFLSRKNQRRDREANRRHAASHPRESRFQSGKILHLAHGWDREAARQGLSEVSDRPLVVCKNAEVGYLGQPILPPIDLEIRPAEFWAVIGRNGSGKTTWLKTVLGLLSPVRGKIERKEGMKLTYLPQRKAIDELYPLLARDVVRL